MRGRPPAQTGEILTVSEFTYRIKDVLETQLDYVRVKGELSQLTVHRSGHVYLSLKDADARIDGVIWKFSAQRLTYRPEVGENIVAAGRINVYAPHGSYKLVIDTLQPAGLGTRQIAFEKLKAQLRSEGLFEQHRKKQLPQLPRCVGVITSATGAARRDIESVVFRRSPQIPIELYPCNVQGDAAVSDLVQGLRRMDQQPHVDVIIVGRGGGSIEDLWAFNSEAVARAIDACQTPVISAVGHETDITIADYVADHRAATPSAAAEVAVPVRDDLLYTLDIFANRMTEQMERYIERQRSRILTLSLRIAALFDTSTSRRRLQTTRARLDALLAQHVHDCRRHLHMHQLALQKTSPQVKLLEAREKIQRLQTTLDAFGSSSLERAQARFQGLLGRLHALSPLAVMERGYSIVRCHEEIVLNAGKLKPNDFVEVLLHEGSFSAKVVSVSDAEDEEN